MNDTRQPASTSSFSSGYRASGLLLHVTSLPSPYGIGDLRPVAYPWIDGLHEAGQTCWQALPVGPTGYGVRASVCANKVPGFRAASIHDNFSARQGAEDDHINIICL